jgi:hypothetical protein
MAGPAKQRAQKEKQQQQAARSSNDSSSASRDPTQRSINKYDGNKDPHGHGAGVLEYTRPNDLKNLSEFLGMAGWYTARGVSANAPLPTHICTHLSKQLLCILATQTSRSRAPASYRVDAWHNSPPPPASFFHIHHTYVHSRKISHLQSFSPNTTLLLYIYLYSWHSLSFMSSKVIPMYQNIYS